MTRKPVKLVEKKGSVPPWDSGSGLAYLSSLAEWKGDGDFNLDNISRALNWLGNPQDKIKSFHVTGTNGKGSVTAGISSILGATGARVGMTVSPHLSRLNERIVIDGRPISDDALDYYCLDLKKCCEAIDTKLSFFEGITAVSFLAFNDLSLDWVVAEVGLGGRLDATNTIKKPEVSVIVSIDLDHEHILGGTLERIAFEKAGIIKNNGKVVIGALPEQASRVIRGVAKERSATVYELGREFKLISFPDNQKEKGMFDFIWGGEDCTSFRPSLSGHHQGENMALCLAAASLAGVDRHAQKIGVEQVFWPARIERLSLPFGEVIIDSAHNPAGVCSLVQYLRDEGLENLVLGFGVLQTKHWEEMLQLLLPFAGSWNLLTPEAPCALDSRLLREHLSGIGISSRDFGKDYARFLETIKNELSAQKHSKKPVMLLCGSMYLVGIIREMLIKEQTPIWIRTGSQTER